MQKIVTCLWCNYNAEDMVNYYIGIFKDGKVLETSYYLPNSPGPAGSIMTINFQLFGQEFLAVNGGPDFPFTNAISLWVDTKTQDEIDRIWDALLDGGTPQECGWITDKYGLSWQIAPRELDDMLRDKNAVKASAVMQAMLKMVKIDIATLKRAYAAA